MALGFSRDSFGMSGERTASEEPWTTVVVTDHGHLDRGGHGGREPEVATAWAAAAGPGIGPGLGPGGPGGPGLGPGGPAPVTRQDQVAALVLAALGDMPAA